ITGFLDVHIALFFAATPTTEVYTLSLHDALPISVSRFPFPGWVGGEVRLEGVGDEEPRDDARLFVLEVSPPPSIVLLASPPDWETRFLARTLEDVARVPVRTFIEAEPGGNRWRDG